MARMVGARESLLPIAASRYVGKWLGTDAPSEAEPLPASCEVGEELLSWGMVPKLL